VREIPYTIRSKFFRVIEDDLHRHRSQINAGLAVQIILKPGGYNGDTIVAIRSRNSLTFETDWPGRDYTRFPQRIRAAATALHYCQFQGLFRIIHKDGMLVIQAIQSKVSR